MVDTVRRRYVTGHAEVRYHGAVGDGAADDSAAIQSAIDAAEAAADSGTPFESPPVLFDPGVYCCNSLNWGGIVNLVGLGNPASVRLKYNGTGAAAGSHILDNTNTVGNWTSFARIENLRFDGWDGVTNSGNVAENLIKNSAGSGADLHYHYRNCTFEHCWGDAVDLGDSANSLVNAHMERVRFDKIGGWCLKVSGASFSESRPITISKFSVDFQCNGNFATTVATLGKFANNQWGKGLVELDDGRGIMLSFIDGRIETNVQLIDAVPGYKVYVHVIDAGSGNLGQVEFRNVHGAAHASDGAILVYDPGANMRYVENIANINKLAQRYYGSGDSLHIHADNDFVYIGGEGPIGNKGCGLLVDGSKIEVRDSALWSFYRLGDIRFNPTPASAEATGWQVVAPTTGHAYGQAKDFLTNAVTDGSTAVIDVSATQGAFRWFSEGLNINVEGAGVASADLLTTIASVDSDAGTITVADATSTAVNPCTISSVLPTWSILGTVP